MTKITLASVALLLLSACVALPEVKTSTKSPAIYGRVLDASTKKPLQGAVVAFVESSVENSPPSSIRCQTKEDGTFAIDKTHNVHFLMLLGPCGDDWPEGHYYTKFEISMAGYKTKTLDIYDPAIRATKSDVLQLNDILLDPKK